MKKIYQNITVLILILLLSACSNTTARVQRTIPAAADSTLSFIVEPLKIQTTAFPELAEVEIQEIILPVPYDSAEMEYSGMAWLGDTLVLLPQYPKRLRADGSGRLITISKADVLDYISAGKKDPIAVGTLTFDDGGLSETLAGFEGFEAIAFSGRQVFVTIETRGGSPMMGYLACGTFDSDARSIKLDPEKLAPLVPQTSFNNASDEGLFVFGESVFTIFEDNGQAVNPNAFARSFDLSLLPKAELDFPAIEFRVTDASDALSDGTFWVMNYFYPGDTHLKAMVDAISEKYGEGSSHKRSDRVERIIKLAVDKDRIVLVDEPPVYLQLTDDSSSRNWEGLARLDDLGFLAVTDSYPRTIFGFIPDLR